MTTLDQLKEAARKEFEEKFKATTIIGSTIYPEPVDISYRSSLIKFLDKQIEKSFKAGAESMCEATKLPNIDTSKLKGDDLLKAEGYTQAAIEVDERAARFLSNLTNQKQ